MNPFCKILSGTPCDNQDGQIYILDGWIECVLGLKVYLGISIIFNMLSILFHAGNLSDTCLLLLLSKFLVLLIGAAGIKCQRLRVIGLFGLLMVGFFMPSTTLGISVIWILLRQDVCTIIERALPGRRIGENCRTNMSSFRLEGIGFIALELTLQFLVLSMTRAIFIEKSQRKRILTRTFFDEKTLWK